MEILDRKVQYFTHKTISMQGKTAKAGISIEYLPYTVWALCFQILKGSTSSRASTEVTAQREGAMVEHTLR